MMIQNQSRYKDYPQIETGEVNIAVVGGGPACKFLITFLETHTLRHIQINIVGVADSSEDAPGLVYARDKGIHTTKDFRDFFGLEDLHLLIEITGRDEVLAEIMESKPRHLRVMGHHWHLPARKHRADSPCHSEKLIQPLLRSTQ